MTSERVLDIFKDITTVPRESGHEEQIIAYLLKFAAEHHLDCKIDDTGNVLIIKEAAKGKENVPVIVLQSHSDMVCEKNEGVEHDFAKDPIKYVIEDGWMIAKETTLGADCGIGMAAQLALLESDVPTGRLECLFTKSEETGMDGAFGLEPGFITGNTLINLDSEDEGELFIGCAGGIDTTAEFQYSEMESLSDDYTCHRVRVFNAMGGHSGDDIDKERANAVQLLARFLYRLLDKDIRICSIDGGNKRNAIAREASAVIAIKNENLNIVAQEFSEFSKSVKERYSVSDPNIGFSIEETVPAKALSEVLTVNLVCALYGAPHGVLAMSTEMKGLVETSTNLASVKMTVADDGREIIRIGTSQRSSVNSERRAAADKVEAVFRLAGAHVYHASEYPGWKPNVHSPLLAVCKEAYQRLFGNAPVVRAIHAGLECGLFLEKYPNLDMISFGPTLRGVHAPGERLDLASLDKFVELLVDVVSNYR